MATSENNVVGNGKIECLVLSGHGVGVVDVNTISAAESAMKPISLLHTTKKLSHGLLVKLIWEPFMG